MLKVSLKGSNVHKIYSNTPTASAMKLPFFVFSSGHFKCDSSYYTERSDFPQHLLIYTISGEGHIKYRGAELDVQANQAFLIDCREHQLYKSISDEWNFLYVHFGGAGAEEYFELINQGSLSVVTIASDGNIKRNILQLQELLSSHSVFTDVNVGVILHSIVNQMLLSRHENHELSKYRRHKPFVDEAVRYIEDSFNTEISIALLAARANLSKFYFIRIFKSLTGQTPYELVMLCRINESKRLLAQTDYSISEISARVGFGNANNYIKCFKSFTGTTPLQFRNTMM